MLPNADKFNAMFLGLRAQPEPDQICHILLEKQLHSYHELSFKYTS